MRQLLFIFMGMYLIVEAAAQPKVPIFRYPDVSDKHIVFTFANNLWIVDKQGGTALQLSSPAGEESWARFSPDGQQIAFSGNYDGQNNVYVIPVAGGVPRQLTFNNNGERVMDWHPDGNHIFYASSKYSGKQRFSQFYKVSTTGGLSEQLPIAHAEMGSISPDGRQIAFTDKTRLFRTWKRYRGGTAPDIHIFNLDTKESTNITQNDANDELPMWCGDAIYYLSDQGPEMRFNIWKYDLSSKRHRQVTQFKDWDVHFPASGPKEIVFESGGDLYLLDLSNDQYRKIEINVVADFESLKPRNIELNDEVENMSISPDGKRVLVEARGEVFNVPSEKGATINLSKRSGSAERYPVWSPDGKTIAYWSDQTGEYELYFRDTETQEVTQVTNYGPNFKYRVFWSPDSKKLAFIDQALQVWIFDKTTKNTIAVAKQQQMNHGLLNYFHVNWSADSEWLTFVIQMENGLNGVLLYEVAANRTEIIDGGLYNLNHPVFDPEGKYLYVLVANHFAPIYSGFDNSWVYTNNSKVGAFVLTKDGASPLAAENDAVEIAKEEDKKETKENDKTMSKGKSSKTSESEKASDDTKSTVAKLKIDFEGIGSRLVVLPVAPGSYGKITAATGKVIYHKYPNSGTANGKSELKYWDLKDREEKTIIEDISSFQLSANGKKLLVTKGQSAAVIDVSAGQKMDKKVDLSALRMQVNPKEEWQQLFTEAWRIQRDYFYDPNMHGVDWIQVKSHYQKLLDRACSRGDVNYVIGEMIGELNASHAYRGGGDYNEEAKSTNVGFLGIDWASDQGHFKVGKIIRAADWDTEVRSPLAEPGVGIKEGDFILSVNGLSLRDYPHPDAAFLGLGNKTVELEVNDKPTSKGARIVHVKTLSDETRLRNLAWIEQNRQFVDKATNGRVGYVYVPSTGFDGQYELVRMFYGQFKKDALIIDERFNNGGQIPDRFIELLDRKPLAYWKTRDGRDWQWPPVGHFGPKAMLINGWSGSGGDAFPDYFRKAGLGPLIGTRTWGGLIGISGTPPLIDGGSVSAPTFRMFHPDGEWFPEGHGVDPDIEVEEDYTSLAKGIDAQLARAVEEMLKALENPPHVKPMAPKVEKRTP